MLATPVPVMFAFAAPSELLVATDVKSEIQRLSFPVVTTSSEGSSRHLLNLDFVVWLFDIAEMVQIIDLQTIATSST